MRNLQEIFVNYIHVSTRLQIERYMQRTIEYISLLRSKTDVLPAINMSFWCIIGKDGRTELFQATPHGHVLPKIQIKQINPARQL